MKIIKNNLLLGGTLLVSVAFLPCNSRALDIVAIIGTAKTIGDAIVGQTTVTPAYALNTWTYRQWGNYINYLGEDIWYSERFSVNSLLKKPCSRKLTIKIIHTHPIAV